MNDLLHTLLGAGLVSIGVLAAALGDRIRQIHLARREHERTPAPAREPRARTTIPAPDSGSTDVVSALVAAGYKKSLATQAALACTPREQATPESWVAAALRRAQGSLS